MDNQQTKNNSLPEPAKPDDFQAKLFQLPDYVFGWLCSLEASKNTAEIAKQFKLEERRITSLAKIIGRVALKDIPLDNLVSVLEKNLAINNQIAQQIAIEIAIKQFLPIRDYLSNVENFIKSLGGQLPESLPPLPTKTAQQEQKTQPTPTIVPAADIIIQKNITAAINEKLEVANQTITEKPLKLADSESLKLPNIKNWIIDYKKYKSNFPDQDPALVRTKYLYESPNGKNLSEAERMVVSNLLKSLDDYIGLPFSQKTGLLLIEKLSPPSPTPPITQPSPALPSQPQPPKAPIPLPVALPPAATAPSPQAIPPKPVSQPPSQLPIQPTPPSQSQNIYREPVAPQDLAGPQAPQRPTPKLNGNIIDLKEFGDKQN